MFQRKKWPIRSLQLQTTVTYYEIIHTCNVLYWNWYVNWKLICIYPLQMIHTDILVSLCLGKFVCYQVPLVNTTQKTFYTINSLCSWHRSYIGYLCPSSRTKLSPCQFFFKSVHWFIHESITDRETESHSNIYLLIGNSTAFYSGFWFLSQL